MLMCMRPVAVACVFVALATVATVHGAIHFHEKFSSIDHWTASKARSDYGKVELSAGKFYADAEKSKGLRLTEDARFYALSTPLPTPITNEKKDFVVSFSVKHEQDLRCGGGYIKLLPQMDPAELKGETKYWLMFGPDRCGYDKKIHIIISYNGANREWKKRPSYPDDKLTHVYTLHITPSNSYEFFLDGVSKEKGTLEADWDFLPEKEIDDPEDKKPADWVDVPTIDDPEDKKPEDWDSEPEKIVDPEAKKPEDWNDAEDGAWEAPMIPNPKSKGPWAPRKIPNPAYKGPWAPRRIPNPAYKNDEELYKIPEPLTHVGIDVWQVESGSIFKDIIIGDDVKEVLDIVKSTYDGMKKAEEDALAAFEKKEEQDEKEEDKKETDGEEDKKKKEDKSDL
ncbi:calreticulin, putative [Trypanosoma equiperdum]|uniref:Calreticulin n=1 Tax=Trypanosoma equiperdum TaxID=5694 RepID=A0A1G4I4J4_TRYEQ|nr:calreticulin, putative [Trypanosoma equiperdum]